MARVFRRIGLRDEQNELEWLEGKASDFASLKAPDEPIPVTATEFSRQKHFKQFDKLRGRCNEQHICSNLRFIRHECGILIKIRDYYRGQERLQKLIISTK